MSDQTQTQEAPDRVVAVPTSKDHQYGSKGLANGTRPPPDQTV